MLRTQLRSGMSRATMAMKLPASPPTNSAVSASNSRGGRFAKRMTKIINTIPPANQAAASVRLSMFKLPHQSFASPMHVPTARAV